MITDIVSLSTIAVSVIALAALYFARAQLKILINQVEQASQATIAQTYSEVSSATAEFNKMFMDNPQWYQYFYEGSEADSNDPALRRNLEHICENFMDYVDVVLELRNSAPFSGMDWSGWEIWFRFIYNNSPALREWVLDNINFFPDYEFAALGFIVMRDPLTGIVIDKWHACEFDENNESHKAAARMIWDGDWKSYISPEGYPWVRTWVMGRIEDSQPAMIAAVSISQADKARVSVHWLLETDHVHDPELLYSWIAGTLSGSKLLVYVVIKKHSMRQAEGEIVYQIRKSSEYKRNIAFKNQFMLSQEPFLLPKYRHARRHYSPLRGPEGYWPSRGLHAIQRSNLKLAVPSSAQADTADRSSRHGVEGTDIPSP